MARDGNDFQGIPTGDMPGGSIQIDQEGHTAPLDADRAAGTFVIEASDVERHLVDWRAA